MSERDNDLDRIFNESLSKLGKLSPSNVSDLSEVSFSSSDDKPSSPSTLEKTLSLPERNKAQETNDKAFEMSKPNDVSDNMQQPHEEEFETDAAEDNVSQSDEQLDEELPDDDLNEDSDDYEGDEKFVEEYTDVSNQKLQFNMNNNQPKKRKRKKKKVTPNNSILVGTVVTVIVIAVSFILSFLSIQLGVEYMGFSKSEESITFEIPNGTTTATIGDLLYQKGIINNPTLFKVVMKLQKVSDASIYPGEITLSPNMTYPSIIQAFTKSRKVYETVTVTFTEGISLYKAAKLLEENEVCSAADFLTAFNKNSGFDFENGLTLSEQPLYKMEGFFFPDTYEFYKEDNAENVVSKIKANFDNKMTDEVMALVEQSGLSLYDVITLASIVQAEADTKENMELVASVFLNRLSFTEQFPHLESDATYFYVRNTISSALGGMDKVSDYEYLYDTYSCFGLPVGAIGNPGMDAIMAVLKPATSNYCFFVTDSKTGEFYYAETLKEHNANCKKAGY